MSSKHKHKKKKEKHHHHDDTNAKFKAAELRALRRNINRADHSYLTAVPIEAAAPRMRNGRGLKTVREVGGGDVPHGKRPQYMAAANNADLEVDLNAPPPPRIWRSSNRKIRLFDKHYRGSSSSA